MAQLLIQNGSSSPTVHQFNGAPVTIGREPENTIVLDETAVSSRHAEIIPDGNRWKVRDLHSSNGTTVNGRAVQDQELHDGDMIGFGSVECRFQAKDTEPAKLNVVPPPASKPREQQGVRRLPELWKRFVRETKRTAKVAALTAQIEKLNAVDLNGAFLTLGKRAFELGLREGEAASSFAEIEELEAKIAELKKRTSAAANETKNEKVGRVLGNAANSMEAQGLTLKIKQKQIAFGRNLYAAGSRPEVSSEYEHISSIKSRISVLEAQMETLSTGSKGTRVRRVGLVLASLAAIMVAVGLCAHWLTREPRNPAAKEQYRQLVQSPSAPIMDDQGKLGVSRWDVSELVDGPVRWQHGNPVAGMKNLVGIAGEDKEVLLNLIGSESDLTMVRVILLFRDTTIEHNGAAIHFFGRITKKALGSEGQEFAIKQLSYFLAVAKPCNAQNHFGNKTFTLLARPTGDAQLPLMATIEITTVGNFLDSQGHPSR